QVVRAAALLLLEHLHEGWLALAEEVLEEAQAGLELAALGRGVEYNVAHLAPGLAAGVRAGDAPGALELLSAEAQLAVQGHRRQALDEPVRRQEQVALAARQELLAVPVGPYPIQLLAHPPAGHAGRAVPRLGQQDGRAFLFLGPLGLARGQFGG